MQAASASATGLLVMLSIGRAILARHAFHLQIRCRPPLARSEGPPTSILSSIFALIFEWPHLSPLPRLLFVS